jgi:hypothetical protein
VETEKPRVKAELKEEQEERVEFFKAVGEESGSAQRRAVRSRGD